MTQSNSSLGEWSAVATHADELAGAHLRDLTAADPQRWQNFHVEHDSWLLDISRQRITGKTLRFSWKDGPTKGETHEHVFHEDGSVEYQGRRDGPATAVALAEITNWINSRIARQ